MRFFFRETFPLPLFTFEKDARMYVYGSERRFLSRDAHGLVVDLFFRNTIETRSLFPLFIEQKIVLEKIRIRRISRRYAIS